MSKKGKKTAESLVKFVTILNRYEVEHVYAHYDNMVVELRPGTTVAEEDKTELNALNGDNNLKPNIWQLHY